jgi:hypothetical protein
MADCNTANAPPSSLAAELERGPLRRRAQSCYFSTSALKRPVTIQQMRTQDALQAGRAFWNEVAQKSKKKKKDERPQEDSEGRPYFVAGWEDELRPWPYVNEVD